MKNIYFSNYSVFQKELKTIAKDNTEDKLVADDTFYIFIFASCSSSFPRFFGEGVFPQSLQSPKKPGLNRIKHTFQLENIIGISIFLSIFCIHLMSVEGEKIDWTLHRLFIIVSIAEIEQPVLPIPDKKVDKTPGTKFAFENQL